MDAECNEAGYTEGKTEKENRLGGKSTTSP
jgi:hypothetical protein